MPGRHEITARTTMILGREPAQLFGLIAGFIQLATAVLLPELGVALTVGQQGQINSVTVAVFGLVTAWALSAEKAAAALCGLMQALVALAVAFGLHWSPASQSSIMAFVALASAFWLRGQVVAKVGPEA